MSATDEKVVASAPTARTAPASAREFTSLQMRGVSRVYGKVSALSEFDLELDRGEFVAMLGPSGCGKSTALACLAGLQPLTSGSIWKDGTRVDTLPPEKRGFGMVFQNYALFPHLSVQRNVEFGLLMQRVPKPQRRERALAALQLVQLSEHASKLPGQLSGGQQQRVAIARALAIDPQVILMDEPLSNLDAALRIEMRTEIKRLYQERDLTVLYVTHDQEEALSLATRLVVLRAGKLEQTGTPSEVYTRPASAYVASFMGYRNLLAARVAGSAMGGSTLTVAAGDVQLVGTAQEQTRLAPGDAVTLAIRPEDLVVVSPGSADNTISAVAEIVEYHGHDLAVRARTAEGVVIHVKTDQRVEAGSVITLAIPVERVLVFAGHEQVGGLNDDSPS